MAKTPAVLWYFNDWHGGTITLTRLMKGCYMELLHAQFNSGHLDLEEIKTVLGKDFSLWGTLSKKFSIDDEGKYFNVRLDKEINNSKKNIPKKMASSCLAGLISSTKNLRYDQIKLVKEVFNINDFIDLDTSHFFPIFFKGFSQIFGTTQMDGTRFPSRLPGQAIHPNKIRGFLGLGRGFPPSDYPSPPEPN